MVLLAGAVHAQSGYPSRPVRLIAPFAPGGPVDVGARLLAPKLQEALGVQVYVENVPGGSGNIGTAQVAKAPGDGHTVLVISSGFVVNPSMFKLTYDWEKELAPVSLVGLAPQVILVHPSVPATNMKELIALVKANPGKYSYGSAGLGTPGFLAGDGHTVLVISSGFVVNPSMFKLTYDWEKELAPVSLVGLAPQVILVHPSVPATNMKELIALVKANPGKYSYGSAGLGTPGFLAGEMLRQSFGIDLQHIPFQGGGPAVVSTVGGHTPIVITTISSAAGPLQQGAIRPLAVTSNRRSPALPDVLTLAEQGIVNQESDVILGVLVPITTPKDIVDRLHRELVKIVADPEIKRRLAAAGFEAIGSTPAEFDARLKTEIAKWAKVIRDAGIAPR